MSLISFFFFVQELHFTKKEKKKVWYIRVKLFHMVLALKVNLLEMESNQTWPIWNSFIIVVFKINNPNVTAKRQRTRKFLKLISCEGKNIVILVPINLYYSK